MSKVHKIKLTVPSPCSEDWDKMKLTDKGRFCERCSNIITDFSLFTDRELVEYLSGIKGKVCGQFANTQLNRLITVQEPAHTPIFRKLLFGTALAAGVVTTAHSQTTAGTYRNPLSTSGPANTIKEQVTPVHSVADSTIVLKGNVVDLKNNKAIADAIIIVEYDSVHTDMVTSDSSGGFSFKVPDKYVNQKITLSAAIYGYAERTTFYEMKRTNKKVNIKLRKNKKEEMSRTVGYLMM